MIWKQIGSAVSNYSANLRGSMCAQPKIWQKPPGTSAFWMNSLLLFWLTSLLRRSSEDGAFPHTSPPSPTCSHLSFLSDVLFL